MSHPLRIALALALAAGILLSRPVQAQAFSPVTVNYGKLSHYPPYNQLLGPVPFRQSGDLNGRFMEVRWSGTNPTEIVVYFNQLRNTYNNYFQNPSPPPDFREPSLHEWYGILAVTFLHEAMHLCLGPSTNCENDKYSCDHIAIAQGTHDEACNEVGDLKTIIDDEEGEYTEEEKQEAQEIVDGMCAAMELIEQTYNSAEGRQAANECACTDPGIQACPFEPDPNCPAVRLPDFPSGGSCPEPFGPGDDVIDSCEHCD